jgi:hypothetical protein
VIYSALLILFKKDVPLVDQKAVSVSEKKSKNEKKSSKSSNGTADVAAKNAKIIPTILLCVLCKSKASINNISGTDKKDILSSMFPLTISLIFCTRVRTARV